MGAKKGQKKYQCITGIVLIFIALLADNIGLGKMPGFGWKQISLLVLGVAIVVDSKKCFTKCCSKDEPASKEEKSDPPSSNQV